MSNLSKLQLMINSVRIKEAIIFMRPVPKGGASGYTVVSLVNYVEYAAHVSVYVVGDRRCQ